MPIYEYLCRPCETPFSEIRSIADRDEPAPCPACSVPTATRTPPSFFVRGSSGSNRPRSLAEQLAGRGVMKPAGDGSTGILGHKCHSGCGC
ncbi:MAG: Zinc ribbon domain [Fibrobacteres bacterium]|nr:Zinc ribbon domain [Fibrobacterota bacterium]